MTPAPQPVQHFEERFVALTIAQGLIRAVEGSDDAWMQPMDPADERFALHRVTPELIEKYSYLNDSYLGDPVHGRAGWCHVLPEDPTLAGWVCGHYLTVHKPTAYKKQIEGRIDHWEVCIWGSSAQLGPSIFTADSEAQADHQLAHRARSYAKVFREVEGQIIKVWVELDQNGEPKCQ